ncbi:cobalt-precorrin 5A hydrolase [Pseudobutyrivibrio xylanivorans]|uniref:Cobalt-precorrin 5A acetaldehyde-lyase n=1 Tax=Pseudobutyrivibrio xylanivorans DSM 14809 TaxID=1123012 RepID=A0A1M6CFQ4_PSEXY|nr:cobalamin biosynthesis protein [Pseudobutyrivibrio xylanivorans]SHI59574.1 cobalt-precorrin 5A acetaldehyde-lyase [Pseudobutyrivibrio xylanivorans DSM 14809]
MLIIRVVYFTDNGKKISDKLNKIFIVETKPDDISLSDWTKDCFDTHLPIIFIGSTGIAVRTIAPFITSKLKDSPVIVIDELGKNVIPILSGHYGGANDLARIIGKAIGANPVITTATDINNVFAVDVFAKKNGLLITDKSLIKKVSAKALKGEALDIKESEDEIIIEGLKLIPKRLILGMGCKKGKTFEELKAFVNTFYNDDELEKNLYAIASIDVKSEEIGLIKLAEYYGVFFVTYSSEELDKVNGEFEESDFVKEQVGVGNVCERSALLLAGEGGVLVKKKVAQDGMTLAEAKRRKIYLAW